MLRNLYSTGLVPFCVLVGIVLSFWYDSTAPFWHHLVAAWLASMIPLLPLMVTLALNVKTRGKNKNVPQ